MRRMRRERTRPIRLIGFMTLLLAIVAVSSLARPNDMAASQEKKRLVEENTVKQVLQNHTFELMSIPGVVGLGEGRYKGRPCLEVYVVKQTPELKKRIPNSLDGFAVRIKQTGEIKSLKSKK